MPIALRADKGEPEDDAEDQVSDQRGGERGRRQPKHQLLAARRERHGRNQPGPYREHRVAHGRQHDGAGTVAVKTNCERNEVERNA
jgi:hypothetical protein